MSTKGKCMSGFSQSTSSGYAVEPTTVWRRWVRFVAVLAAVAVVGVLGSVRIAFAADGPPTLVSDQADYPPGGTVVLSGANWASGEQVHIVVNDDAGQTWSLSSGSNGAAADPVAAARATSSCRRMYASVARPAAQETGFPAYV